MSPIGGNPNEIGLSLRMLREQRGLGVRALARAVGCSPSWISKVEAGRLSPSRDFILAVAPSLKLNQKELSKLLALLILYQTEHHAVPPNRRDLEKQQRAIARLFREARVIRSFHAMILPGILQTNEYARTIFRKGAPGTSWQAAYKTRIAWRKYLRDHSKQFIFLIHENALRFRVCGKKVMRQQIQSLQTLSKSLQIQVIPADTELPVVPPSDFAVFDDNLVVVDTAAGVITFRRPGHVKKYIGLFEAMEKVSTSESAAARRVR